MPPFLLTGPYEKVIIKKFDFLSVNHIIFIGGFKNGNQSRYQRIRSDRPAGV